MQLLNLGLINVRTRSAEADPTGSYDPTTQT
jgi:hypothetical protein